jgi:hypothetical protein
VPVAASQYPATAMPAGGRMTGPMIAMGCLPPTGDGLSSAGLAAPFRSRGMVRLVISWNSPRLGAIARMPAQTASRCSPKRMCRRAPIHWVELNPSEAPRSGRSPRYSAGHSQEMPHADGLVLMRSGQCRSGWCGRDHHGPADLTPFAAENLPWLKDPSFADMTTPTLVVAGDHDDIPLSVRGPDWMTDPVLPQPRPQEPAHPVRRGTLAWRNRRLRGQGDNRREPRTSGPDPGASWAYLRHSQVAGSARRTATNPSRRKESTSTPP